MYKGRYYEVFKQVGNYVGLIDPERPVLIAYNDAGVEFTVAHFAVHCSEIQ